MAFSHSWDCACRFYHLHSPAALTLMNDTCMGTFPSVKTGQHTAYHAISIKLSYSPKQGGHNHMATWEQSLASAESRVVPGNCFGECLMAQAKSMSATALMTSVPVPQHCLIYWWRGGLSACGLGSSLRKHLRVNVEISLKAIDETSNSLI